MIWDRGTNLTNVGDTGVLLCLGEKREFGFSEHRNKVCIHMKMEMVTLCARGEE